MNINDITNINMFTSIIIANKLIFDTYTVYIKIRYNRDSFFMAGNQIGFNYVSIDDLVNLYNAINIRLEEYFSVYNLQDDNIIYVQISLKLLDRKIYSGIMLDKDNLHYAVKSEVRQVKDIVSTPIVSNYSILGAVLNTISDINNIVTRVDLDIIKNDVSLKGNFIDMIKENNKLAMSRNNEVIVFDNTYKFYYVKSNRNYVLVSKQLDNNTKVLYK